MSLLSRCRRNWPEYLIEAWALGTFMVSAGVVTVLVDHPQSPVASLVPDADVRRAMIGLAMGLTAIGLIYSPWGKRSGAHMNPAVTLTFMGLGKVAAGDALFYVLAQITGGLMGVALVWLVLGELFSAPPVSFVVTLPGDAGIGVAFLLEFAISFGLMSLVLNFTSRQRLAPFTGVAAGVLVATYITFEAPFSGMSMNPARSLSSAAAAGAWNDLWLYLVAPPLGMACAAGLFQSYGEAACAKFQHTEIVRCIHCGYQPAAIAPGESGRNDPAGG